MFMLNTFKSPALIWTTAYEQFLKIPEQLSRNRVTENAYQRIGMQHLRHVSTYTV